MVLIIRRKSGRIFRFLFSILENTIHFAINIIMGGIPARFNMFAISFFLSILSFLALFSLAFFVFFISVVTKRILPQYGIRNQEKIFVLRITEEMVHLVLNTEEYAKISLVSIFLRIERAPITADEAKISAGTFFSCNEIKKDGAIFCQVNRILFFVQERCFLMLVNHLWNGAAAILIPSLILLMLIIRGWGEGEIFLEEEKITKIEEAMDWITRYFILLSFSFFFFVSMVMAQKERVFNSSIAHTINHEFEKRQAPAETMSELQTRGRVLMCLR